MHDENAEIKPCDACGDEVDTRAIPCGLCNTECRECDSCSESRYVANDCEPSMLICSACRRAGLTIKSVVPCRAEKDERRDVDEEILVEWSEEILAEWSGDDLDMGGES